MKWEKVKLKDICLKIGSGATPKGGATVYISEGTSLIRSQNVYNLQFDYDGLTHITDSAAEKLNGVKIEADDILLNITGDSVARTCIVPIDVLPARVNQHVAIVRPDKNKCNPFFLNYYLACPIMQATMLGIAVGKGTSRNALTKGMIQDFEIPLPDIAIQNKIADTLNNYTKAVDNCRKQISLLEEAAQRLYKEWFVDFRFPGHESVAIIDGLPEGWSHAPAEILFPNKIGIGKTPSRKESKYFSSSKENNTAWASVSDINQASTFILNTSEYLTPEGINDSHIKLIPSGSILVSFKLTVGKVAIASSEMTSNEAIAHFIVNDIEREYLYLFLKNFEYSTLGSTSSIGTAVNSKIIRRLDVLYPTEYILKAFHEKVNCFFKSILVMSTTISSLLKARDLLLPRLMSGEIEIKA